MENEKKYELKFLEGQLGVGTLKLGLNGPSNPIPSHWRDSAVGRALAKFGRGQPLIGSRRACRGALILARPGQLPSLRHLESCCGAALTFPVN